MTVSHPKVPGLSSEQVVGLTIWAESRGEPVEGQIAVGCVIRNRFRTQKWGDWAGVCWAPWQFSCWMPQGGAENYRLTMDLALRVSRDERVTDDRWHQALWIASGVVAGVAKDNTLGSTHYFASYLNPWPKWARGHSPVAEIGAHLFFRGIA